MKRIQAKIIGQEHAGVLSDADLVYLTNEATTLEEKVTELFDALRLPVYQYLVAVFGNAAEAEDLTQDVFLSLYKALRGGQTIRNVRFWIFRVAQNAALNRRKHNQYIAPLDADSWAEIERLLPSIGLNPEQNALYREKFERLYEGLKRLSMQERQAIYLRSEGFKYREIGELMNVKITTVEEFLQRGIRKLSEQAGD